MNSTPTKHPAQGRVSAGVAGLDTILHGGLIRGNVYLLQGEPGAGKTILGSQACFQQAMQGERALFVTLRAENHARLIGNLRGMAFFDEDAVPDRVTYLSLFGAMRDGGLAALPALLRREITERKACFLVIDSLVTARTGADDEQAFKDFVHDLQELALVTNCTMLLTTNPSPAISPEESMVDGIIELTERMNGWKSVRDLRVTKFRGGNFLPGRHSFEIDDSGVAVYPRLEALYAHPSKPDVPGEAVVPSGMEQLDAMLGGGLPLASSTIVVGPSGSGKTTFGIHFLAASSADEPGLMFGLYENPARLASKIQRLRSPLMSLVESGVVELMWNTPAGGLLDPYGHRILDAVDRLGAKRLYIDGLTAFRNHALDPARITNFFPALASELRVRGVTTMYSLDARDAFDPIPRPPIDDLSNLAENLVMLRFAEHNNRLRRLISVPKVRDGNPDPMTREYVITETGIHIETAPGTADAPLTGMPDIHTHAVDRATDTEAPGPRDSNPGL